MKKKIFIFPTFQCTMNCPRCYQRALGVPKNYMMSIDTCRKIFERLMEQNYVADEVVFTGGEPTLWPFLKEAIESSRAFQRKAKVRVVTNGLSRSMSDYGAADIVQVSDYGGINRIDQYRLKKQGKSRVKIQTPIHWSWDKSVHSELPGKCGCNGLSFVGNQVWPCAMTAAARFEMPLSIEQDFVNLIGDPEATFYQDFCSNCLVNSKNRQAPKPVLQISLWEGKSIIIG